MFAAAHYAAGFSPYLVSRLTEAAPSSLRRWAELGVIQPQTFIRNRLVTLYSPIDVACVIVAVVLREQGLPIEAMRGVTRWLYKAHLAGARWERHWLIRAPGGELRLSELESTHLRALSIYLPHLDELPLRLRFGHSPHRNTPVRVISPSIRAPVGSGIAPSIDPT